MPNVPPAGIASLKAWTTNFDEKLTATPTAVGCTAADATAYHGFSDDFLARVAVNEDPATRTKVTLEAQRVSKLALLARARQLCKVINAFPGTTDPLRISFGLNPRDGSPTPAPVPATRPQLSVDPFGNVRIVDETTPQRRGKPQGVFAAVVFSKVGQATEPDPTTPDEARYAGLATRGKHTIPLPPSSNGKTLWVLAQWVNDRGEAGPVSAPVRTTLAA